MHYNILYIIHHHNGNGSCTMYMANARHSPIHAILAIHARHSTLAIHVIHCLAYFFIMSLFCGFGLTSVRLCVSTGAWSPACSSLSCLAWPTRPMDRSNDRTQVTLGRPAPCIASRAVTLDRRRNLNNKKSFMLLHTQGLNLANIIFCFNYFFCNIYLEKWKKSQNSIIIFRKSIMS